MPFPFLIPALAALAGAGIGAATGKDGERLQGALKGGVIGGSLGLGGAGLMAGAGAAGAGSAAAGTAASTAIPTLGSGSIAAEGMSAGPFKDFLMKSFAGGESAGGMMDGLSSLSGGGEPQSPLMSGLQKFGGLLNRPGASSRPEPQQSPFIPMPVSGLTPYPMMTRGYRR